MFKSSISAFFFFIEATEAADKKTDIKELRKTCQEHMNKLYSKFAEYNHNFIVVHILRSLNYFIWVHLSSLWLM